MQKIEFSVRASLDTPLQDNFEKNVQWRQKEPIYCLRIMLVFLQLIGKL